MATLIVHLHCMCLFVPDPGTGSVHVLMPGMHGPGHDHGHDHGLGAARVPEKHVVRMLHRTFTDHPQGRPMEGWSLVLGGRGPAGLELNPPDVVGAELPDLTALTQKTVDPSLLTSTAPDGVVSRVTFRAGSVTDRESNPFTWTLGGRKGLVLANVVTWAIPNIGDELEWVPIGTPTSRPPILSLRELAPEAGDVYRISIHHETERTLPGSGGGRLSVNEMKVHFATFYRLLGMAPPSRRSKEGKFLLPDREGHGGGGVMCMSAMAHLTL